MIQQDEPPTKKSKVSDEEREDSPYPFAKLRGIRIFSEREINGQGAEMTRKYWKFWNLTAEELCSDGAYNDWGKRDLKLYIDAAWVVNKTHLQEQREKEIREDFKELLDRSGSSELPVKLRTEDENVTELLAQVSKEICSSPLRLLFIWLLVGALNVWKTASDKQTACNVVTEIEFILSHRQ